MSLRDMTPEQRAERMQRVWEKHLRGELATLEEFLRRRERDPKKLKEPEQ